MAPASVSAVFAASASVVAGTTSPSSSSTRRSPHARALSFRLAPTPKLPLSSSKDMARSLSSRSFVVVAKSQPREVAGDPSKDSVIVDTKTEELAEPSTNEASSAPVFDGDMSELMSQISSLVKLVDSRDIVELQLKQQDFELVLRKKEALPQPPPPVIMMQSQGPPPVMQPQYASPPIPASSSQVTAGAGTSPSLQLPPSAPPAKSLLPLKSPMAGTFYRSPGPGQAPFVKVGDKVNKGQVLCIIEAMKLMNEIELLDFCDFDKFLNMTHAE
ncbi:hypothetical protein Taro_002290 [Colocasia esculenta]|uniref:Biotin carboxyl carrier protein of acetyl-CoA carboxylase n=1 Tax=Colocasia esculenta TaxID=4460 RepID=A0A843TKE2_COLES|nr:hypothetical protein [Colocasia esculenta]